MRKVGFGSVCSFHNFFNKEKPSIIYIFVFLLGRNQPAGAGPVGPVQAVQQPGPALTHRPKVQGAGTGHSRGAQGQGLQG